MFFLSSCCVLAGGQERINIYNERVPSGFVVYADNAEFCPVSLEIKFKLVNLKPADESETIFVVPPRSERVKLAELSIVKAGKESNMGVEVKGNYGDHFLREYDEDFVYHLPYGNGESYTIGQGYNGNFSHHNENALDFNLPPGTEICAARGGVVCKVVENHHRHCPERECNQYNNYIRIYHDDGTFADYQHIQKNGAIVNEGDQVEIDQVIGYSGNTGWSSGPHLHFCVYLQRIDSRETLKTRFRVSQNGKPEMLVEKGSYRRAYE